MAYCGQCGFKNPEGAKFCGGCGADLTLQEMGNVETIVNESGVIPTMESEAMAYVPLDTPSVESVPTEEAPQPTPEPVTPIPTPQPASQPTPSVQPQPPIQPVPQPPVQPVAPPTPPVPPTPVAPAPQQVIIQTAPSTPQPMPQAPKSGGGCGKTCLGCGCITIIISTLIICGLAWWGYSYIKKNNKDINEVLEEWVDKNKGDWGLDNYEVVQDPENTFYEGKTLSELAEESNFPSVTYNECPKEGRVYKDKDGNVGIQFNYMQFNEGDYIGEMTATNLTSSNGEAVTFKMASCGCSIYHMVNPDDDDMEGYIFVEKGAERILISDNDEPVELMLSED